MKSATNLFNRVWAKLSRRQRQILIVLGIANSVALSALIVLLLRPTSPSDELLRTSPLSPQRLAACRQEVSRALFNGGQTGVVQTREDGVIVLQIQHTRKEPPDTASTASPRLDADAATWTALEAVAVASRIACLGFHQVQVTIVLQSPQGSPLRATARASLTDLLSWSLGEIDDAELSLRVDYQPPTTPTPDLSNSTPTYIP
jgi:hypothetical protein